MSSTKRKKAIVTGASHGIGRGVARVLANKGYDVVISYNSNKAGAESLKAEIEANGESKCYIHEAHLEKDGVASYFICQAIEDLGGLDLLVNNAGRCFYEPLFDMKEETIDLLLTLDFRTYIITMREAARYMKSNHIHGSLINITSSRAERAYPGDAIYGAMKAALNRAVQSIALDCAPYGIRVNNVAPGATRTMDKAELAAKGAIPSTESPDWWDELSKRIPLGREGQPEDIGNVVAALASDEFGYCTGITVRVDGGLILPGMPEDLTLRNDHGWGFMEPKSD